MSSTPTTGRAWLMPRHIAVHVIRRGWLRSRVERPGIELRVPTSSLMFISDGRAGFGWAEDYEEGTL